MSRWRIPKDAEIQPADPAARTRALIIAAIIVAAAVALLFLTVAIENQSGEWFREYLIKLAARPAYLLLAAFIVMLPMAGISVYVFRHGSKIVKAERVPLPGQKVISDTPIITGAQAVRQGRILQGIAVFMGVSSLVLPFLLAVILMLIQQDV